MKYALLEISMAGKWNCEAAVGESPLWNFKSVCLIDLGPHVRSVTDTREFFICKERHRRSKVMFKLLVDFFFFDVMMAVLQLLVVTFPM